MAAGIGGVQGGQAAVVIPPMQQVPGGNPQQPPPLQPNTLNELGLVDTNWFKVVITKCPTGGHEGTASVSFDRWHGLWSNLPDVFIKSAVIATSQVPIKELILKNHRLSTLPANSASEGHLDQSLTLLDVSGNCFKIFPCVVCKMLQLQHLIMCGNHLSSLSKQFINLTNLKVLALQNNKFHDFPVQICHLNSLSILNLENNSINCLPNEIGLLENLKELYLKSNKIVNMPPSICNLLNLDILHIADNLLTTLPQNISGLQNLKQLHLAQNKLVTLPESLSSLSKLQGITLNGNPLRYPPLAVCRKGLESIMMYLRTCDHSESDSENYTTISVDRTDLETDSKTYTYKVTEV